MKLKPKLEHNSTYSTLFESQALKACGLNTIGFQALSSCPTTMAASKRRRASVITVTVTCSGKTLKTTAIPAANAFCSLSPKVSRES